jgi:uncharacterized Zn finger protein (UPF0148 family)
MAYCIRCKGKKELVNPVPSKFKNGTPVLAGTCPDCGSKLFEIQKKTGGEKPLEEAVE